MVSVIEVINTELRPDYMPDIDTPICVGFIGEVLTCIYRANDWLFTRPDVKVSSLLYVEERSTFYVYFD